MSDWGISSDFGSSSFGSYDSGSFGTDFGSYDSGSFSTDFGSYDSGSICTDFGSYDSGSICTDFGSYDSGSLDSDFGSYDSGSFDTYFSSYDPSSFGLGAFDVNSDYFSSDYDPMFDVSNTPSWASQAKPSSPWDYSPYSMTDTGTEYGWKPLNSLSTSIFGSHSSLFTVDTGFGDFSFGGDFALNNLQSSNPFAWDNLSSTISAGYSNDPFSFNSSGQFNTSGCNSISGSLAYDNFSLTGSYNPNTYSTSLNSNYNFSDTFGISAGAQFHDGFQGGNLGFHWRF